jgi:hypothetical protein
MPGFVPTDIGGLLLWLDAADQSTITKDADNFVSLWTDRSGGTRDLAQSTAAAKPTGRYDVPGGAIKKGAVEFDGAANILTNTADIADFSQSSGEVWAVITLERNPADVAGGTGTIFSSNDTASDVRLVRISTTTISGAIRLQVSQLNNDTGDALHGTTTALKLGKTYIVRVASSGTAYTMEVDGVSQSLTATSGSNTGDWFGDTSARDNVVVGGIATLSFPNGRQFFPGKIHELLVFNAPLSSTFSTSLLSYLQTRWQQSFSPADLSPALWLDAAALASITKSAGAISAWDDKSGNNRDVSQATGANQPTFRSHLEGRDGVDFDGSTDVLSNTTAGGTFSGTSGEVWAVFTKVGTGATCFFASSDVASNTRQLRFFVTSGVVVRVRQNNADTEDIVDFTVPAEVVNGSIFIVRILSTGSAWRVWVNGVEGTASVISGANNGDWFGDTSARDNFSVGAAVILAGTNSPWDGSLRELLVVESANLSDANAELLYQYLKDRWQAIKASAKVTDAIYLRQQMVLTPKGTATIVANLIYPVLNATISAKATLAGALGKRFTENLTVAAKATLAGAIRQTFSLVSTIRGTAIVDELIRNTMKIYGEVEAQANLGSPGLEHYRPVVNPALSGDLVDLSNKLRFKVNSNTVDLTNPYYNLGDLRVGYDGKYLSFTEIPTPTVGHATWRPEQLVQMELDFGSGFKTYFKGKIKSREHVGENNNELIRYEAVGYQVLSNDVTVLNTDGRPEVLFTASTTVATAFTSAGTVSTVASAYTMPVSEAIQRLFTLCTSGLSAAGIPATIGNPGLERFTARLPERVQLRNTGFFAALSQLAALEPGVKPFFDDVTQTWIFPNLLEQTTMQVNVNSVNLVNAIYNQDTNDRYTAVRLFADPSLDVNTLGLDGRSGYVGRQTVELQPDWDPNLQPSWNIYRGTGGDTSTTTFVTESNEYFWVYRRYRIPQNVTDRETHTPVRLRQRYDVKQTTIISTAGTPQPVTEVIDRRWVPIKARVNFKKRLVIADVPLIDTGNPYENGSAQPAAAVQLTFWPLGVWNYTYASSVNSDGTVATTAVTQTRDQYLQSIRYPQTGFRGTAYDVFGIEREYVEIVHPTEVTTQNAQAKLNALKDIRITGDLPIEGDPLEFGINLQAKLRIEHPSLATGLNSYAALVTSYRYEFGKRGKNTISLSTDVAGLVRL